LTLGIKGLIKPTEKYYFSSEPVTLLHLISKIQLQQQHYYPWSVIQIAVLISQTWLEHSHLDAHYTVCTAPAAICDEHQNNQESILKDVMHIMMQHVLIRLEFIFKIIQ